MFLEVSDSVLEHFSWFPKPKLPVGKVGPVFYMERPGELKYCNSPFP